MSGTGLISSLKCSAILLSNDSRQRTAINVQHFPLSKARCQNRRIRPKGETGHGEVHACFLCGYLYRDGIGVADFDNASNLWAAATWKPLVLSSRDGNLDYDSERLFLRGHMAEGR